MRLADILTADEVRQLHLSIFRDAGAEYLRRGPLDDSSPRDVEQKIRNVKDSKIRRNLRAIAEFEAPATQNAWSHHMAVNAGTHLWPDANHRTAFVSFSLATSKALGVLITISPDRAREMREKSKARRDADYLANGRYYTIEELVETNHPYRQLFASFESSLTMVPARDSIPVASLPVKPNPAQPPSDPTPSGKKEP